MTDNNEWFRSGDYVKNIDRVAMMYEPIRTICNKTILITGATGTIGSYLSDLLIRTSKQYGLNNRIILAGRSVDRLEHRFSHWDMDGNIIKYLEYDLNDTVNYSGDVDYIFHLAGNAYPAAFNEYPVETIEGIINGTSNILKFSMQKKSCRIVYVSSGEVYGECDGITKKETDAGYINSLSSRSCYPLAKRLAENLCVDYIDEYGLDVVIARPCHTFGMQWSKSDNRAHVQFLENAISNKDIVLHSNGSKVRSYLFVADCCTALISIALFGTTGSAYNIASKEYISIRELAEIISNESEGIVVTEKSNSNNSIDSPIEKQILECEKIYKLEWKPLYTINSAISEIIKCHS